jgi:hypothetical protein
MRARLLVIGALLALAGAPPAHAGGCPHRLPHGPPVPAPVVLRTACGVFELRRDGTVVYGRMPRSAPAWAPGAQSHPDARTWVAHPHRRLAVYRDGRLLWHSHITGGSDDVAVGHGRVAFTSYRHASGPTLWIAPLGGRERVVAHGEDVVGWVAAGLVTQRGSDLRLRTRNGRFLRTLARSRIALPDGDRVVVLRTDGVLARTDGWRSWTIADLRRFELTEYPWLQRLDGGMWEVESGRRVLVLDGGGRRFASFTGAPAGNVVVLPDRRAVLVVLHHRSDDADPGVLTVYRLEQGASHPRPLFSARVRTPTCGDWGALAYRRGRVLFSSNEAGVAILDPAGRARPIDLTGFAGRLLPQRRNAPGPSYVGWAS